MAQIKITLTKSPIGRIPSQRKTVVALGLGKLNSSVIKEDNAAIPVSYTHLKAPVGRKAPSTPWGKPALGLKTRNKKAKSDKLIVRRRNEK